MVARPLRAEDSEQIGELLRPRLVETYGRWEASAGSGLDSATWYRILVEAVQQESSTVAQMVALCEFALAAEENALASRMDKWTAEAKEAWGDPYTSLVLDRCLETLRQEHLATTESAARYFQELRHYFRDTAGVRGQRVMSSVRAALTGSLTGPCLGIVATLLGWQRCIDRIRDGLP
jgi:hypothetical protein